MWFLLYLNKCSRCRFVHSMWWWLRIQYFQLDNFRLVDKALSLCSCWWSILCFLYICSWLLQCFCQRFCAACAVVGNIYLIILKSTDKLSLPHFCCMVDWTILYSFFFLFFFVFLFGLDFDIVTFFEKRFFIQWGNFVEYCFVRGVVGESLFYCFC